MYSLLLRDDTFHKLFLEQCPRGHSFSPGLPQPPHSSSVSVVGIAQGCIWRTSFSDRLIFSESRASGMLGKTFTIEPFK